MPGIPMPNGRCTCLLLLVAAAAAIGPAAHAQDSALGAAARKEGHVTWYVASLNERQAEAAGHLFSGRTGLTVHVVSAPAPVMFQRLTQNLSRNANDGDVFSAMDIGNFVTLKTQGALAAYVPANAAKLLPVFQGLDKDGTFYATVASVLSIAYNNEKLAAASVPQTWTDMLDPKWAGKIALVHPAFSIQAADWAVQVNKMYGRSYLERMSAQRPAIARSVSDAIEMVASGERMVTVAPAAAILEAADQGDPVSVQYPRDGAFLIETPSAVLKSAPHPNAARMFMNFLLGPEFGKILVQAHYLPPRRDIALPTGAKRPMDIKMVRPTVAEMTSGVPQVAALWRDIFGR